MRILLLCHYFAPEPGAPQARLLETARAWRSSGHRVTVLTAFPNHPTGVLHPSDRGRIFRADRIDDIEVLRSFVYATPNRGILKKTLGHLSLMASSALVSGLRARKPDVVVVSSPTFFSVFSAFVLSRRWRVPLVFEVRDLWPAIFRDLGVLRNERVLAVLEAMEMFLYRRSAKVVTVTEGFRRDIVDRGIPSGDVVTITNGVDAERFRPLPRAVARRRVLGADNRFTVLYLGAHGISHALLRVLDLAERFRDDPDLFFLLVGDGAEKPDLVREAKARGLANVDFRSSVSKEEVPWYYAAADLCLVPLRNVPLFRTFIPSKLFEILGCGRPILASLEGEAADILHASGGAVVVPPEDVDALARELTMLRASPERLEELGTRGREHVVRHYERRILARRYEDVLRGAMEAAR